MPAQDLHAGLHSPIQCQLKPTLDTQSSYAQARNNGDFCPQFHSMKRLPWEVCHKHRNIRRERPAGATPATELRDSVPCVAAVFVLLMAGRPQLWGIDLPSKDAECGNSGVCTLWEEW